MGTYGRERTWGNGAWGDRAWSAGALAVTCTPLLVLPWISYDPVDITELAGASNVVAHVVIVFSALLLYLHWRLTNGSSGWLVMTLTALSLQGLALSVWTFDESKQHSTDLPWILVTKLVVAVGVFAIVLLSERITLRLDPLALGVGIGLVVVGVRRAVFSLNASPPVLTDTSTALLGIALLVVDLAISIAIVRLAVDASWLRWRLVGSLLLLCIAHAATYSTSSSLLLGVVIIVTYILGSSLLLSFAAGLARTSWLDNQRAIDLLARQLEEAEAEARADRAKLHEIRATVAGLGSASRLVQQTSSVGEYRRKQLEDMIQSEMARLQRLLHESGQERSTIDLDAAISPIVLRHRTRGYPVEWTPTGDQAIARADDVAEVISVLLENAYQHAPQGSVSIVTRRTAGVVEIAVSDTGPGIDRSLRSRIFEWGGRGSTSRGSGIGLNVAYKLSASLGGYLQLVDSPLPGTTFVLGLPSEELT